MPVVPAGSHDGRAARRKAGHGVDWLEHGSERAAAAMVDERYAAEDEARMAELNRVCVRGGTCMHCGGTVADSQLAEHPGCCATCGKKRENRQAALERFGPPLAPEPEEVPDPAAPGSARSASPRAAASPAPDPAQIRAELERKRDELARVLLGPTAPRRAQVEAAIAQTERKLEAAHSRAFFTPTPALASAPRDPLAAAATPTTTEEAMPCGNCKKPGHNSRSCPETKKPKAAVAPARQAVRPRPERRERATFGILDEVEELQQRARARLAEIDLEVTGHQEAMRELADEAGQLRRFLAADADAGAGAERVAEVG